MQQQSYSTSWKKPEENPAAIFDVDGTLANVSGIRYHVNLNDAKNSGRKDFAAFHSASVDVPAHKWVAELARATHEAGIAVWVVTARKFKWRYHTVIWLYDNNIPYYTLQMRPDNDIRSDVRVKEDILYNIRKTHNILFAVDDNPHVIKLWEDEDIPVITVPGWETNSLPGAKFDNSTKKSESVIQVPQVTPVLV